MEAAAVPIPASPPHDPPAHPPRVTPLPHGRWIVRGTNRDHLIVLAPDGLLSCTCADFIFRKQATGGICKHITLVAGTPAPWQPAPERYCRDCGLTPVCAGFHYCPDCRPASPPFDRAYELPPSVLRATAHLR